MTRMVSALLALFLLFLGFWFFYPRHQHEIVPVAQASMTTWHDYTSPQGKFHIKFPSLPHYATETLEDPATHEKRLYDFYLSSKDEGTIYAVNMITFPEKRLTIPSSCAILSNRC